MRRTSRVVALVAALAAGAAVPPSAAAFSAVFAGDPTDPATGTPWEILPGQPLVTAGADGRLGTRDDVVDPSVRGDVDLVVRLGAVPPGDGIPATAAARNAVATGVAGPRGVGTPIPFAVYLSDGATSPATPAGNRLAAADMTGLPVIVLLFADRDADGFIGPRGRDPRRDVRALAELEPVGREVAFFDATGAAFGTIVVTAGGPASTGGATVVATALAFTGPYDEDVFEGHVPTGPAISTAQPFLPERDPMRFLTHDLGPLAVDGTLGVRPAAASIPDPSGPLALALRASATSPTTDLARAVAGPAVCARLVEPARGRGLPAEVPSVALGTIGPAAKRKLALVAVDRLGNPTDPPPGFAARITLAAPVAVQPDKDGLADRETVVVKRAKGTTLGFRATGAGASVVRVTVAGALCQELAVAAAAERDKGATDARVALKGSADFRSVAAAAASAVDRNGDGRVVVAVADGVYRETVPLTRAVTLLGAGAGRTVLDARGDGPAITIGSPSAVVAGVTASGGTVGVEVAAATTVSDIEARGNVGAGIALGASGAAATACEVRRNGGPGILIGAPAAADANHAADNTGPGIAVHDTAGAVATANVTTANEGGGIALVLATDPAVSGNAAAGNGEGGIMLEDCTGGVVAANRIAANDGDGLQLEDSDGALVVDNDCTANGGFGMRIDGATADFSSAPGTQPPPGSNDVSGNSDGEIEFR